MLYITCLEELACHCVVLSTRRPIRSALRSNNKHLCKNQVNSNYAKYSLKCNYIKYGLFKSCQ